MKRTTNILAGRLPTRRRLRNPRMVQIAPRVDAICYSFTLDDGTVLPHGDCDAACKRAGHRYQHDYEKRIPLMWDTHTGKLII